MPITRNRFALTTYPYYKHSLRYALDSLQRLGAGAIEFYAVEPHLHIDDSGTAEARALKKEVRDRGMHIVCLTPEQMRYPINIASSNPNGRKRSLGVFTKCIEFASELECPVVQFHAGYPLLDESYDEAWKRSVQSLSSLARIAEGYGVVITLEYVDIAWKTVLLDSCKAAAMISEVGSPNVMGMFDTVCLTVCGETVEEPIRNFGDKLRHCHFTDGTGDKESTLHLVPGEGVLDLQGILTALDRAGYQGYLSVELLASFEECPHEAMGRAMEWAMRNLPE